jgi:hypothetical protein
MLSHEPYQREIARIRRDIADTIAHLDKATEQGIWTPIQADNLKMAVSYFQDTTIRLLRHVYFGTGTGK